MHIAQNQNTHTHTLTRHKNHGGHFAAFGATKTPPLHQFLANFNIRGGRIHKKYLFGCVTKVHRTSAGGFFIQRGNSLQCSIMLHGNSDNCGNYDNDGGGVQNVSGNEDGDDDDDDADDVNEDGSGGDVGGVDGVGVEATMTTTTIMKTTMMAATQQSNGARIGEGTTTATAMSTMSATFMVVVMKAAALTVTRMATATMTKITTTAASKR